MALVMGAAMAAIMLACMLGMYASSGAREIREMKALIDDLERRR